MYTNKETLPRDLMHMHMHNHYLTELKILKSVFFKSYDVNNVTPLGKPVVKEFYIRLCPHK